MKEIKKEKQHIEYVTVYQATDGTEFTDREECIKYETSAKGVLKSKLNNFIVGSTKDSGMDAWDLMGGDCDNEIIAIKMTNAEDLDVVKQYMLLDYPFYNIEDNLEKKNKLFKKFDDAYNKGDSILFGINCEGDYYFINSKQNIIDNLNALITDDKFKVGI